jgi:hypothetical protein
MVTKLKRKTAYQDAQTLSIRLVAITVQNPTFNPIVVTVVQIPVHSYNDVGDARRHFTVMQNVNEQTG